MRCQPCPFVFVAAILAAVSPASAQLSFTEDFSTTTYKDAANTTADWNTSLGELRLLPFAITSVGTFDTAGNAGGVAVSGNLLFVADDPNVAIFEIANVTAPILLGTFAAVDAQGVDPQGDLLYVAAGSAGLMIVDVTDPTSPVLTGAFDTVNIAWDVAVEGDVAYVANGTVGLLVFDVSNPAAPVQIGSYNTPGDALRLDVNGDYCYIADRSASGLVILDVTDPTTPTFVSSLMLPGDTWSVVVDGDLAYVSIAAAGLTIVDVSDPSVPAQLGTVDPGSVRQFWVSGDILYAAGFGLVHEIDVSNPNSPVLVESWDNPGTSSDVVVDGEHAFVADGTSGIQVLDVRRVLKNPVLVGTIDSPGFADAAVVAGHHAFVADGTSGLRIIDVFNPASPVQVGFVDTPDYASDVAVAGDYAFVCDGSSFRVVDIENPTAPVEVASLPAVAGDYTRLAVAGNHAFVFAMGDGLRVINIANPTLPVAVGYLAGASASGAIAVAGDYAFWAYGSLLLVVDVSNPTNPTSVATHSLSNVAFDVAIAGDCAFVMAAPGLQTIDVSDPTLPSYLDTHLVIGERFALAGNLAFVSTQNALRVIDISNPAQLQYLGETYLSGDIRGLAIAGQHAFVGNGDFGMRVFRVFQGEFDTDHNQGQSLTVHTGTDNIVRIRLTPSPNAVTTWRVSANGGQYWQFVDPLEWLRVSVPGSDLWWRSTHEWIAPGTNPAVDELQFEWFVQPCLVDGISDVPDDQGGEVRIEFTRSGYDFEDELYPATGYQVYQRVDAATAAMVASSGSPFARMDARAALDGIDASRTRALGDRRFVVGPFKALAGVFPPGVWEAVGWVAATQSDSYTVRVSTTADSTASATNWSVYLITTHTTRPSDWYISSIDSSYSVDNIAPGVPQNFAVAYNTGSGNSLAWDTAAEPDFQFHRVYRSTNPNFVPTPGDLVHETSAPSWIDPEYDGWNVHYKVTTLDHAGNESDPASPGTTTDVSIPGVPTRYQLHANAPDPFNPSTQIRYDVPVSGEVVSIRVFDVAGRLVRTLVEGPQSAGTKSVGWNGCDDRNRPVASGIYFYRMQAGSFTQTRSMALLK